MQANKVLYDSDWYAAQQGGSYQSASTIVPIVREIIAPRSVCDVGCGVGTWLRAWTDNGVHDVYGLDGAYVDRSQLVIDPSRFCSHDLRMPLPSSIKFDLAMSLEVAEHLPPSRAESFVANLTALAPVVLFSAAIPQQGGTGHINEQWQSYWASLFAALGYLACDVIRPVVWENQSVERWYRQNTILYCREDAMDLYPRLQGSGRNYPLSIVHPKQYIEITEEYNVAIASRLLGRALRRAVSRRISGLTR